MGRRDWRQQAECAGCDTELFFDPAAVDEAIAICADCPVRAECTAFANRIGTRDGVWGGVLRSAPHGTVYAYDRHIEWGQVPCSACVKAHSRAASVFRYLPLAATS